MNKKYYIFIDDKNCINYKNTNDTKWFTAYQDRNLHGYKLPIAIDNDSQYYCNLKTTLLKFSEEMHNKLAHKYKCNLKDNIANTCNLLIESIELYYEGQIASAKNNIMHILNKFCDNDFFVSPLNCNYAFRGIAPFADLRKNNFDYNDQLNSELNFFRARVDTNLNITDMLHIPLNQRDIIPTSRFSIAGIPCLYVGTTSYCCWLELDKPDHKRFFVSSIKFNCEGKQLRILNLVISEALINGVFGNGEMDNHSEQLLDSMYNIMPLVIATSYRVSGDNRKFKSEYIISQLIMHCLKELKIDGVAYLSKKGKDDYQYPQGVNLAIPVFDTIKNGKYGKICSYITLTEPYNFFYSSPYNKNCNSNAQSYVNLIYNNIPNDKIDYNGHEKSYSDTSFSEFDNYLVNQKHYPFG